MTEKFFITVTKCLSLTISRNNNLLYLMMPEISSTNPPPAQGKADKERDLKVGIVFKDVP